MNNLTLYRYRTGRIKGNGRIRMALAISFFASYVMFGLAYAGPQKTVAAKEDARIVAGYFFDPTK